jgi:hypothetical protein
MKISKKLQEKIEKVIDKNFKKISKDNPDVSYQSLSGIKVKNPFDKIKILTAIEAHIKHKKIGEFK